MTDGEWKYIFDTKTGEELYDVETDPAESDNRIGAPPEGLGYL